ncbi:MAG TPA: DPP IV N-terminal domain-containing protein [Chitinophagales bacterium]|nr:DPP IV N-terminal domain-containing protein [Chitinophagales bacterium]
MSIRSLLIVCFLISTNAFAQNTLTLEDAVLKGRQLAPGRLEQLAWIPHTNTYTYVVGTADKKLVRVDAVSGKVDTLDIMSDIRKAVPDYTAANVPFFVYTPTNYYFQNRNKLYAFTTASGDLTRNLTLDSLAENTDVHAGTLNAAYTIGDNLFVNVNGNAKQVAKSDKDGIVYGKAVHRNEFGITQGTFWSPNGNKLAYYRLDESMVTPYNVYNLDAMPATSTAIRYPYAGATSHHAEVWVYEVATDKSVKMEVAGPAEQYVTNIAFSPDEKHVFIQVLNRDQNDLKLNQYDAVTGKFVKTILTEANAKYVEPEHPITFIPNTQHFLFFSERDGYNSIYQYDLNGNLVRQLAKGLITLQLLGLDAKNKNAYVIATKPNSIDKSAYKVSLDNGKAEPLGPQDGTVFGWLNTSGDYLLLQHSSTQVPRTYYMVNTSNNKQTEIYKATNPLITYTLGTTEMVNLKSTDGTPLFARLIKPSNFDATKKYPVVTYVYGGPHAQMVTNSWLGGGELWQHYLANKGYLVFVLDNRGSDNRGFEFESAVHRRIGVPEMEDQNIGAKYLRTLPYVDSTRMGVYGWSYGGFMSLSMKTRMNNTYKVAVAGGPVIGWDMYEVMYTERYMDTPQQNEAGYKNSNLLNYVDNLNGKTLLIHGTSDNVVLWQHSLAFLKACVDKGKQVDYFVYPGHEHNVMGKDRLHLMTKVTDYFIENL